MAQDTVNRRLAAILAADMVGYSRLMQLDEAGIVARQSACLKELVTPAIKEFRGRLVKTTGDGFLVDFPSAVDAVLCAVKIQREMAAREQDVPSDQRIVYRVGINVGEIIYDGDDIFGDGVNVAARLEALADPGGIHISKPVFDNVKGKLDLGFANLGAQKVKNIAQPVPMYQVLLNPDDAGKVIMAAPKVSKRGLSGIVAAVAAIALLVVGLFYTDRQSVTADATPKRLLVLPFTSLNGDGEIYADAVSENLWLSLARIKGMTLVARKQALKFKGMQPSREQIATQGVVTHVLDGTVATDGADVIIKSRLRAVSEGGDTELQDLETRSAPSDVFDGLVQHKTGVTSLLKIPLNANEREYLEQVQTQSVQAYLLYAEGLQIWMTGEINGKKSAVNLLKQATEVDRQFFDARGTYADWNYFIWFMGWNLVRNNLDAHNDALAAAAKLLIDDPLNSDALFVQSAILLHSDREKALTMARGAIFQKRDDPYLRRALGWAFLSNGLFAEARAEFQTYLELSPRLTSQEILDVANAYLRLDEPERALELLSQLEPEALSGLLALAAQAETYSRLGRLEEGKKFARKFLQIFPFYSVMWDEPKFRTFNDPAIFQSYSEALQNVGIPLWTLGFDKGREADRLDEKSLSELFSRSFRTIDTTDPVGGPYTSQYNTDGTVNLHYGFLPDIHFQGTWEIAGDEICQKFPAISMGMWVCERVYVDREKTTAGTPRYIQMNGFGLHRFGVEYKGD